MIDSIVRVGLTQLQIPLKEPLRTAVGEIVTREAILLAAESADGLVGVGECSPLPAPIGTPAAPIQDCWNDLATHIAPNLLGQGFGTLEGIDSISGRWRGCRTSAVAGAETALWDLLGHARSLSLAELLGVSQESIAAGVESGLTMGLYPTVVDLLRAIEPHLAEGYRRLKIKIRPGRDLEFVAAVRQHFGQDMLLSVDGDGSYSQADFEALRRLDDFDLLMIEQPLPADDIDGLAALQQILVAPICLDETAVSPDRAAAALEIGAGRIVNLKIQHLGGLGPALALHELCRSHGVACVVGTTPELGVGQAQAIHLGTLPNCRFPSDVTPSARWFVDDYIVPLIEMSAPGMLGVPERPGLGYQVDETKLRRYQTRHEEFVL